MKQFQVIVATNQYDQLAVNGTIPWKSPEDMNYFKTVTTQVPHPSMKHCMICGRKTWDTMKHITLKNRIVYVISSDAELLNQQITNPSICYVSSFDSAVKQSIERNDVYKVWVIGGRSVYLQAFYHPLCGDIYWNHVQEGTPISPNEIHTQLTLSKQGYQETFRTLITKPNQKINRPNVIASIGTMEGVEVQYLRLMSDILMNGERRPTRNADTFSIFHKSLSWDMRDGFPLLTTKKMFWKGIVEELLFFIRGDTQTKKLEEKGVRIWKGNTTRDFLDSRGFIEQKEGDMGPMYGYQWRQFNKPYHQDTNETGVDQLRELVEGLQRDPNSRRHLLTTYNPSQVHEGVLYPCHSLVIQCYVERDGRLSMNMYQRSADVFLGLPFNIASTSLLCMILAKICGREAGRVSITLGDAHIYTEHVKMCKEQLKRECYPLPTLRPLPINSLQDVEESKLEYYVVKEYQCHPRIAAKMMA